MRRKFRCLVVSQNKSSHAPLRLQIAREHGFIAPTVYQGNYSALARRADTALFPTLRKEGMSFTAYSPLAMGLLSGKGKESAEEAAAVEGSR